MQYFRPKHGFVGDCMPFWHEGTFHLYYLLDEDHHRAHGGLGGHQWAHSSTRDLIYWTHHPLAVAITEDWEGSICTGSVFFNDGKYHAFYATRKHDRTEHLSHAVGSDGIVFEKLAPNPFASPPPGYASDFRDPFVFTDDSGAFHMLVTARMLDFPLQGRGGCLLRFVSSDLARWQPTSQPFLIPSGEPGYPCMPECSDHFSWNGWHYLVFGLDWKAHYRMSRSPMGPWVRPAVDTFDSSWLAVMKTATFGSRRIGAAFLGSRQDDKDNGGRLYAGHVVFRELVQNNDGTLGARFPDELVPTTGAPLAPVFTALTSGARVDGRALELDAIEGQEAGFLDRIPHNARVRCVAKPGANTYAFGLGLRGSGSYEHKYDLRFDCHGRSMSLAGETVPCAVDLSRPCQVDVVMKDDIIDVCVGNRQCIINRCPELRGSRLFFFCHNGSVRFEQVDIRPLTCASTHDEGHWGMCSRKSA